MPPSPTAAALGRFGELPVGLYTGVPSVEIPVFTLPGRSLSLPIKLQYHGGGVRVDEVAPWTGLSWSLNAGGAITRTCRGIDDFAVNGFLDTRYGPVPRTVTDDCDGTLARYEYLKRALSGEQDTQPDIFSFNLPGYSGKIIFKQDGTPCVIPTQPIQVQHPGQGTGNTWTLTTPDGTRYIFGSATSPVRNNGIESTYVSGSPNGPGISAWYLTQIVSPQGETVELFYKPYQATTHIDGQSTQAELYYFDPGFGPVGISNPCEGCARGLNLSTSRADATTLGQYLWRIRSATHRVDLFSDTDRTDQPGVQTSFEPTEPAGFRRLTRLRLTYLPDSSRVREVELAYDYSTGDRLTLRTVTEVGLEPATGQRLAAAPYRMRYRGGLPPLGSYAQDYWGYYNGQPNAAPFPPFRDAQLARNGANRACNPAVVTNGLLEELTYPTGGTTTLTFEPHEFSNIAADQSYTLAEGGVDVCAVSLPAVVPDPAPPTCGNLSDRAEFDLAHEQEVQFTLQATAYPARALTDLDVDVTLTKRAADGSYTAPAPALSYAAALQPNANGNVRLWLTPGHYRLQVAVTNPDEAIQVLGHVTYQAHLPKPVFSHVGGGVRIRRLVTYDGLDHARDQVREYYYTDDSRTRSTGRLLHKPVFNSWRLLVQKDDQGQYNPFEGGTGCTSPTYRTYQCRYLIRSAEDVMAANGTANGSQVGYDYVTVLQRDGTTAIRSQSTFLNLAPAELTLDDFYVENQGQVAPNAYERNGQLLLNEDFAVTAHTEGWEPATRQLVRRVVHTYATIGEDVVYGLSLGGSLGDLQFGEYRPCQGVAPMAFDYRTYLGWWPLTRTEETRYDLQGNGQTTTTDLFYDNLTHQQPTRQEVTGPDGRTRITRTKYAADYAATAEPGIRQLQARYMLATPIEQQQWLRRDTQPARWLGGKVTRFAPPVPGAGPLPTEIHVAALGVPQAAPAAETVVNGQFTSWLPDGAYRRRATLAYTPQGSLQQQALEQDVPTAYVWDAHGLRVLAEAVNAPAAHVAATSFEADSPGGWHYAAGSRVATGRTGSWAYQFGPGVTLAWTPSESVPGGYTLCAWAIGTPTLTVGATPAGAPQVLRTDPGGWQWLRWQIAPVAGQPLTLTGGASTRLDEVRVAPARAQVTTLTYDALGGVTSKTDPSGRTSFYEYDSLGRLLRVRDEQGRILTEQEYRYASQ